MNVETATVLVAGIRVIIAAINSIISSRRAEEQRQLTLETQQQALETRQAQLYMQIYNRWNSRDLVHAYGQIRYHYQCQPSAEDWYRKYGADVNPS